MTLNPVFILKDHKHLTPNSFKFLYYMDFEIEVADRNCGKQVKTHGTLFENLKNEKESGSISP